MPKKSVGRSSVGHDFVFFLCNLILYARIQYNMINDSKTNTL